MILLQEIFDTLATGEFSHLKLGNSLLGTIAEENYPKIVSAINMGLLALHTKFPLRKGEFIIHQHPSVSTYYLRKEFSDTLDGMGADYYIELGDSENWPGDFIKLNSLWDADQNEIPLNDNTQKTLGGFTPSFDILTMVPRDTPIVVHAEYRARYPKIVITNTFDPEKVQLHIPDYIVEALLFYTASRVFRGISSKATEGEVTSSITFSTLYRTACLDIQNAGLVTTDTDSGGQFESNGFI